MKIVVLTTQTAHHSYFVAELKKTHPIEAVIEETTILKAPFPTHHAMDDKRDQYEKQHFFEGKDVTLGELARLHRVDSINSAQGIALLESHAPDIVIVFGTGRLSAQALSTAPNCFFNLHGGDPQKYRGLDSHLWAIYHKDFESLNVTLHSMNTNLDEGDVVNSMALELNEGMHLFELRALTTKVSVKLVRQALDASRENPSLTATPQKARGRYYSWMPAVLKDSCENNFNNHMHAMRKLEEHAV